MLLRCVEEVQPAAIRHPPAGARAHSARWPSIKSRFAKTWTSQKATFGSGCRASVYERMHSNRYSSMGKLTVAVFKG